MGQIKITQVRSTINRPKRQKETLRALGLRKIDGTVTHEVNDAIMGMVAKVEHLVKVEKL